MTCPAGLRVAGAVLLGLALTCAEAEQFSFRLTTREVVESRLNDYRGKNQERGVRLKQMFVDAGCGEHVSEQRIRWSNTPNVICVLPGTSDRVLIVGAHFDRVPESAGVADNWSGASLLPSLYEAVKVEPRRHTYIFIGFTDEEVGLIGSDYYVTKMTREQVAATDAMINLDTLGLAPSEIWASRSDERLMRELIRVANYLGKPLSGVNFERVGSTDSESFARRKIPRITIHSLTQKSVDDDILHTSRDQLSALNLDEYYDTYHLVALYLVFLDQVLGESE